METNTTDERGMEMTRKEMESPKPILTSECSECGRTVRDTYLSEISFRDLCGKCMDKEGGE
jgi:hypothetical protein